MNSNSDQTNATEKNVNHLTAAKLIEILQTMPADAIVVVEEPPKRECFGDDRSFFKPIHKVKADFARLHTPEKRTTEFDLEKLEVPVYQTMMGSPGEETKEVRKVVALKLFHLL